MQRMKGRKVIVNNGPHKGRKALVVRDSGPWPRMKTLSFLDEDWDSTQFATPSDNVTLLPA